MALKIINTDHNLLEVLADFRLLTARQAAYILGRNMRALQRRLDALVQGGVVYRYNSPAPRARPGRPEQIYGASEAGAKILTELNILDGRLSPQLVTGEAVLNQSSHQHLVNMFRFSILDLERQAPEFTTGGISSNSPFSMDVDSGRPITWASVPSSSGGDSGRGQFIPDFVFQIHHEEKGMSLLFFLEADTGSEPLASMASQKTSVSQKIRHYQEYFRSGGYKFYESHWDQSFNGFRLLFLCSDPIRARVVGKTVRRARPSDFIWVTSANELMEDGVPGAIWCRGGKDGDPRNSILGSLVRCLPLPFQN